MSARDRLIEAGMKHIASYELELGVNIPGWRTLSQAFLDLVEKASPAPYLELFARSPRLGWDSWGKGYEGAA